ncbi:MAG: FmdB family zinc ribbon protein [Candidatus Aminicenantaceae bacterium]
MPFVWHTSPPSEGEPMQPKDMPQVRGEHDTLRGAILPIYEFECQDCGKTTEFFFRATQDNVDLLCSQCHSTKLLKIFSAPATVINRQTSSGGLTCCGSTERCDAPPCSNGNSCRRDQD